MMREMFMLPSNAYNLVIVTLLPLHRMSEPKALTSFGMCYWWLWKYIAHVDISLTVACFAMLQTDFNNYCLMRWEYFIYRQWKQMNNVYSLTKENSCEEQHQTESSRLYNEETYI